MESEVAKSRRMRLAARQLDTAAKPRHGSVRSEDALSDAAQKTERVSKFEALRETNHTTGQFTAVNSESGRLRR